MSDALAIATERQPAFVEQAAGGDVLIATVNRPDGDTGVHAHTRSLSNGLAKANIPCRIVSPFTETSRWLPIFAVRPLVLNRLNKTWGTRWYRFWHRAALRERLGARIKCAAPAAIVAQCPLSAAAALEVRSAMRLDFPIAMVCHFNHSEATEYREKGELADDAAFAAVLEMEVDTLQRVDAVFYVSEWCRRVVEVERGIAPRSSAVIWNGIDEDVTAVPINRASLDVGADDVVLVNVGSLESRKNQLGLLDLFARVAKEYPSSKLVLVGDGLDRAAIEKKIDAIGLRDRVKCLGFRTDVNSIFAAADLYVHYAKLENCPVILLEAARAGLPVASLPAGGASEILRALGGGSLLTPDDLEASMKTLRPLLWDTASRRTAGARLRQGFESRFTQSAMVGEYLRQLNSLGARLRAEAEGAA